MTTSSLGESDIRVGMELRDARGWPRLFHRVIAFHCEVRAYRGKA